MAAIGGVASPFGRELRGVLHARKAATLEVHVLVSAAERVVRLRGELLAEGAQGLLVAMISRARTVLVAILGLGAFAGMALADRVASARLQRKLRLLRARAAGEPVPP